MSQETSNAKKETFQIGEIVQDTTRLTKGGKPKLYRVDGFENVFGYIHAKLTPVRQTGETGITKPRSNYNSMPLFCIEKRK